MTEMKQKGVKQKSAIQVNRSRGGGKKKPDLFANLRNQEHPLDSLLPVELEFEISDTRDNANQTPEHFQPGHTNTQITNTREIQTRTSDKTDFGRTNSNISDAQLNQIRTHEEKISDANVSELPSRTHEKTEISDTKTPEKTATDTREKGIATRKKYDANYEAKRKQETSRDRMNLRPNIEIGKKIRVYCAENLLELTEFFEISATYFLENLGHTRLKNSDINAPYNNLITSLWKTRPSIIKLYLSYNAIFNAESKWKSADDKIGIIFNNADIRLIEVGIIQTHGELYEMLENGKFRKKDPNKKINAFSYYRQKIESNIEMFDGNEKMTLGLLEVHRQKWLKWTGKEIDLSFFEEGK